MGAVYGVRQLAAALAEPACRRANRWKQASSQESGSKLPHSTRVTLTQPWLRRFKPVLKLNLRFASLFP
jgi:hypothetical protein